MYPPRMLVIGLVSCFAITGCVTSPTTTPSPTPTPTVLMCTPEFGGEPFACTQADHDQMLRNDQRYAEAERVYRRYAELSASELVARAPTPSAEFMSLAAPTLRSNLQQLRDNQLTSTFAGTVHVVSTTRVAVDPDHRGHIALLVCTDRTNWTVTDPDGTSRTLGLQASRVQFEEVDGPLVSVILPAPEETCT